MYKHLKILLKVKEKYIFPSNFIVYRVIFMIYTNYDLKC